MEAGIRPVGNSVDVAVLDRIVVNVIDVALEIPVIAEAPASEDEPDSKTVALIASLLEPKSKETDDKDDETDPVTELAEAPAEIAAESKPTPEVVPEQVVKASAAPSEPVTEARPVEEV